MYTLRDALKALRRLGVEPGEIEITREIYAYIVQQAREVEEEEADDEDEPY